MKIWKGYFKVMYFLLSSIVLKFVLLAIVYPKADLLISKIGVILGVLVISIGAIILAYEELKLAEIL